jgi:hypothetical protein
MSGRGPSEEAYGEALNAAQRMHEAGVDPHHIAASLLYLEERARLYDALLTTADRYLRFGMPEHELAEMRRLVELLRQTRLAAEDADEVDATLPI